MQMCLRGCRVLCWPPWCGLCLSRSDTWRILETWVSRRECKQLTFERSAGNVCHRDTQIQSEGRAVGIPRTTTPKLFKKDDEDRFLNNLRCPELPLTCRGGFYSNTIMRLNLHLWEKVFHVACLWGYHILDARFLQRGLLVHHWYPVQSADWRVAGDLLLLLRRSYVLIRWHREIYHQPPLHLPVQDDNIRMIMFHLLHRLHGAVPPHLKLSSLTLPNLVRDLLQPPLSSLPAQLPVYPQSHLITTPLTPLSQNNNNNNNKLDLNFYVSAMFP